MRSGIVSFAVAMVVATTAFAQDKVRLAVGQRGGWDSATPELGQVAGIFKKHGLVVDILWTQGSGETVQAVVSGSVDIGVAVGTTGAMSAFVKGAPVRPVASLMTGADDLFWYVPARSPLQSMRDAAGKTIAYSTTGSSTHLAVLGFQRHFGIAMKIVPTGGPAATLTQTLSGQIDIGWSLPPMGIDQLERKDIRILARESDVPEFRDQTVRMTIGNLTFITEKPDVLDRFRKAYSETITWMYANDDALKVYGDFAGVSPATAREIRDGFYPQKNLLISRVSNIAEGMKDTVEQKFLQKALTDDQLAEFFKYYAK